MTLEELNNVQGRAWEDVDASLINPCKCSRFLTINSIDLLAETYSLTPQNFDRCRTGALEVHVYRFG